MGTPISTLFEFERNPSPVPASHCRKLTRIGCPPRNMRLIENQKRCPPKGPLKGQGPEHQQPPWHFRILSAWLCDICVLSLAEAPFLAPACSDLPLFSAWISVIAGGRTKDNLRLTGLFSASLRSLGVLEAEDALSSCNFRSALFSCFGCGLLETMGSGVLVLTRCLAGSGILVSPKWLHKIGFALSSCDPRAPTASGGH